MSDASPNRWRGAPARAAVALAVGFAVVFARERWARAEDRATDAAAQAALTNAQSEFASKSFDAAIARLSKALAACGQSRCTPSVKSALLRDIGTMQFRKGNAEDALHFFVKALKLEPDLELDPRYDAADVHGAWEDAAVIAAEPPPPGDFSFEPPPEQKVNTPIPIYVEYHGKASVSRVVLEYMNAAGVQWKRVELKHVSSGWGGLIPCEDVVRGRMRVLVQGFAGGAKPIVHSGARGTPFLVAIRPDIHSDAPHLPGANPPHACDEPTLDCPPDFPGCGGPKQAIPDGQPASDQPGPDEKAAPPGAPYAKWWVGVAGAFDVGSLPAGDDVCRLDSQGVPGNAAGYYCTNPDGSDFPTRANPTENSALAKGKGGHVDGSSTVGNVRVMLAIDYALSRHLLVGGRLGYVIGTYTGAAAGKDGHAFSTPIHVELRGTWMFGTDPLVNEGGVAPIVFAGGGASAFDRRAPTSATVTGVAGSRIADAWITGGPLFLVVGAGARYAFSPRTALTAAIRADAAFGGSGGTALTFGPEIAMQYGF